MLTSFLAVSTTRTTMATGRASRLRFAAGVKPGARETIVTEPAGRRTGAKLPDVT